VPYEPASLESELLEDESSEPELPEDESAESEVADGAAAESLLAAADAVAEVANVDDAPSDPDGKASETCPPLLASLAEGAAVADDEYAGALEALSLCPAAAEPLEPLFSCACSVADA